jgi:heat shock protein HtpX
MSIYKQIAANRFKTVLIFLIFIFILSGIFFFLGRYYQDTQTFLILGLIVSLGTSFLSYFFADKLVLTTTGAKPAKREEYFDYYTVAENLSMAAGIPKPKLYVIDDPSPNAFATGRNPKNSAVCVTRGLLQRLDRSEIEGVIAHELAHIKNYDILLMTIVTALVGTVALVTDWVQWNMFWGGRRTNETSRNPIFLILFIAVIVLSPIIAMLIQLAISRRREYLADASAALLTRYPEGLARALEKIAEDAYPMKNATTSTAHLFISNPFKKGDKRSWIAGLFSTHPPITERIRILRSM